MVVAIANLAMATESDRAAIAQLNNTVLRLMTDIATVNTKLVVTFQANCVSQGGCGGRNITTRG